MKTTNASLLVILAAVIAVVACNKTADKYVADSIAFNRVEMQKSYRLVGSAADYEREADISFGCQVDLLMPTALYGKPIAAVQDSILMVAFGSTGANHMDLINNALAEQAKELQYEVTDTVINDSVAANQPFLCSFDAFTSVKGSVEALTSRVMSYAVTSSQYLPGAAHGMYGTRYINYDLENGVVLSLKSLFTNEGLAQLPEIIRNTAVTMEAQIGKTDITALPANDNFYISTDGNIVFAYQPYEVASYAQGEILIPVPGYLLSSYLTIEGDDILLNQCD